jgi:hypothetical protein
VTSARSRARGRDAATWRPAGATSSKAGQTTSLNPVEAQVLDLQRAAGNDAVARLLSAPGRCSSAGGSLALQRQTPPTAPATVTPAPAPPSAADRMATAETALKDGRLDDAIWATFRERGGSPSTIADILWKGQLGLSDVQPSTKRGAERTDPAAKLKGAIEKAVDRVATAKLKELRTRATSKDGATALAADITRLTGRGASWNTPDVVNQLWREWVGPGSIARKSAGGGQPKALYDTLASAAANAVPGLRRDAFGTAGVARLDAAEITAVENLLRPRPTWVREDEQYATLADEVHRARGRTGGRQSPEWQALNGRMPQLVVVAEANIVNGLKLANTPVTPVIWAEFRGKFIATISKTIWRYHADNIVDASIFGYRFSRDKVGQGMHREAVPTLRAVEESALRLSGKSSIAELKSAEGTKGKDQGTMRNPITLPGTEFRFEPMSHPDWMRESAKISPHGTGRAIDFRLATNPAIGKNNLEMLRFLAGAPTATHTVSIDWGKLRQQAGALAPLLQRRLSLEQLLATEKNEEARKLVEQDLATVNTALAAQTQTAPLAVELRESAQKALDGMTSLETSFQTAWLAFADKTDDKELMAALLAHADKKKAEAQAELTKVLATEAKAAQDKQKAEEAAKAGAGAPGQPGTTGAPGPPGTTGTAPAPPAPAPPAPAPAKGVKAKAPAKAKPPAPPPKSAEVQALELAIARIDKLRALVTVSATAKDASRDQKAMAKTLRGAAANGLTDLPLWMVQAFVEQGWTWGGSWGGFLDAMHFDYLGPLSDVIA